MSNPDADIQDEPPSADADADRAGGDSYVVEFADEQSVCSLDLSFLEQAAVTALAAEEVAAARISVALLDDQTIRPINRRHLGHDGPTDVLSFLLECRPAVRRPSEALGPALEGRPTADDGRGSELTSPASRKSRASHDAQLSGQRRGAGKSIEGEVVISVETAARQAARYGWEPQHETALCLVHGILHLAGYDDLDPSERQLMRSREKAILQESGLSPKYDEEKTNDLTPDP